MIERFEGNEGKRKLISEIIKQKALRHNEILAARVVEKSQLKQYNKGDFLIEEGDSDDCLYFIISGGVDVQIKGQSVATREAPNHVGEMSAIDPSARRSASVLAKEEGAVVLKLSEEDLSEIADDFPFLWRQFALELATRLRERAKHVKPRNECAQIFIGCSAERLNIARALQEVLEHDHFDVIIWSDSMFEPTDFTLAKLISVIQCSDFGVFFMSNDDVVTSRNKQTGSPRDNVILECGMFIGAKGQERTFIVTPRDEELKIPSDLAGFTFATYEAKKAKSEPIKALASVANKLRRAVSRLGPSASGTGS